jgi:hypothetical protein
MANPRRPDEEEASARCTSDYRVFDYRLVGGFHFKEVRDLLAEAGIPSHDADFVLGLTTAIIVAPAG